jgi:mannose-6-phosphate isomerase
VEKPAQFRVKTNIWPQTERLKAALARLRRTGETTEVLEAVDAYNGLRQYLNVEISGLWRDKLQEDGFWVEEPAPGSSLYHITCAYVELIGSVETLAHRNSVGFKTA